MYICVLIKLKIYFMLQTNEIGNSTTKKNLPKGFFTSNGKPTINAVMAYYIYLLNGGDVTPKAKIDEKIVEKIKQHFNWNHDTGFSVMLQWGIHPPCVNSETSQGRALAMKEALILAKILHSQLSNNIMFDIRKEDEPNREITLLIKECMMETFKYYKWYLKVDGKIFFLGQDCKVTMRMLGIELNDFFKMLGCDDTTKDGSIKIGEYFVKLLNLTPEKVQKLKEWSLAIE